MDRSIAAEAISPANQQVIVRLDKQEDTQLIAKGRARAWNLPDGSYLGIKTASPLIHRTAISIQEGPTAAESLAPQEVTIAGPILTADTGEVVWDASDQGIGCCLLTPRGA